MFVNGVPFLVREVRGLNLLTAEHTPCTAKNLASCIKRIMSLCSRGGFRIGTILMDNEFEKLKVLVPEIVVNMTTAKGPVPEVKHRIRLINEHGCGFLNMMPHKKMPQVMHVELIYHVVLSLNAFPTKIGVSKTLSSREIVICQKVGVGKHSHSVFGSYCKVHVGPTPTNMMVTRSTPVIVLGPTANLQDTYKFFSLATGKKVKWRITPYLMPESVIKQVETYGASVQGNNTFDFANCNGILFE
jgi:hypothetical protein